MRRCFTVILIILAACAGCTKGKLERYDITREMMGTFVTITLWASSEEEANNACTAAFAKIDRVDSLMSTYRADSEISKVNRVAGAEPVPLSDEMLEVLELSAKYSELSGGAFDVTVAPLMKLWKTAERNGAIPDAAALEAALEPVGYRNITLDSQARTVRFAKPLTKLDLGGIAKGYAVDLALAELAGRGITAGLVNAGGDIATLGGPPETGAWRIGIQKPDRRNERLPDVVHLTTGAVATSGDYERFVEIGGRRFSHIKDPRTGMPVEKIYSVTVIAPNATAADALATACSVLGPAHGIKLAARLDDVEVMYIIASDAGPAVTKSEGFDQYLK
ncbi:MAG: FAD:protein FMN transferase [Planctomycetes bacterium]|nr:FAD:protein FMN transferase [Planctomycetota bacterium]